MNNNANLLSGKFSHQFFGWTDCFQTEFRFSLGKFLYHCIANIYINLIVSMNMQPEPHSHTYKYESQLSEHLNLIKHSQLTLDQMFTRYEADLLCQNITYITTKGRGVRVFHPVLTGYLTWVKLRRPHIHLIFFSFILIEAGLISFTLVKKVERIRRIPESNIRKLHTPLEIA